MSDKITQLQELQVRRKFFISLAIKQTNALGALARRTIGVLPTATEDEREKVSRRAASIIAALMSGKPNKPEDAFVVDVVAADVAVVKEALAPLLIARKSVEKEMVRIVKSLPVYPWAESVRGFGDIGLAVILGETGDLEKYSKVDKVWKRLGLAPYNGMAGSTWRTDSFRCGAPKLTDQEWINLGYSKRRLGQVFGNVTESLIKAQGTDGSQPYRAVYDRRRAHTLITHPEWGISPKGKPGYAMHYHKDALRVMTKALISDLWSEWRRASGLMPETANIPLPVATPILEYAMAA
jgi:hypothetical protein